MDQFLNVLRVLRKHFPVLFSPQFWGIVGTALFVLAGQKGWFDAYWMEFFSKIFGFGTAVGITNKTIRKLKPADVATGVPAGDNSNG